MSVDEYISLILSEKIGLDNSQIKRFLRYVPDREEFEAKLRLLESHDLLRDIQLIEGTDMLCVPLLNCKYDELVFAIQVPDIMRFSESQKREYNRRVLYWTRYNDIRDTIIPALEKICDKKIAAEIVKNLYISAYTTVNEEKIIEICECLHGYPDTSGLLNSYLAENWYYVFSIYSDPISVLKMIQGMFQFDHVIEVFTDSIDWNKIGYLKNDPAIIQREQQAWASEVCEKAKRKYSEYLRKR